MNSVTHTAQPPAPPPSAPAAQRRALPRLSRLIEELLVLPIALPGLASALALLVV